MVWVGNYLKQPLIPAPSPGRDTSSFCIHQHPQVLLGSAALNLSILSLYWYWGWLWPGCTWPCSALWHSHGITSWVCAGPSGWQPVSQLGVICKFAEAALDPTLYVIDENVKHYQSQQRIMWDTTHHWAPSGHWVLDHYHLDVTFQPILHLPNSSRIKNTSLQFREKDVLEDHVKSPVVVHMKDI